MGVAAPCLSIVRRNRRSAGLGDDFRGLVRGPLWDFGYRNPPDRYRPTQTNFGPEMPASGIEPLQRNTPRAKKPAKLKNQILILIIYQSPRPEFRVLFCTIFPLRGFRKSPKNRMSFAGVARRLRRRGRCAIAAVRQRPRSVLASRFRSPGIVARLGRTGRFDALYRGRQKRSESMRLNPSTYMN